MAQNAVFPNVIQPFSHVEQDARALNGKKCIQKRITLLFEGWSRIEFKPQLTVMARADFVCLLSILPASVLKAWRGAWRGQDRLDAHKQTKEEHETTGET